MWHNSGERNNILEELKAREATYFLGNDTDGDVSVATAYKNALDFLQNNEFYDPYGGDNEIKTFEDAFPPRTQTT